MLSIFQIIVTHGVSLEAADENCFKRPTSMKNPYWHMVSFLFRYDVYSVTGPLCGDLTGHRWIPLAKASDAELWCFIWYAPKQTVA